MITDIFLFNDEFDILRCRMHELEGVVDRFIGIEGNLTLAGDHKPYRLAESGIPGVESVRVDLREVTDPGSKGRYGIYWERDRLQRLAGDRLIDGLPSSDVVLYGDVDEIPRRNCVKDFTGETAYRMMMDLLIYSTLWTAGSSFWTGTVIGPPGSAPPYAKIHDRRRGLPMLPDAGWHLTWFGGEEAVVAKARMFAHGEATEDIPRLRQQFREHRWPMEGTQLTEHTGDLPSWIEEGLAPGVWGD